MEIIDSNIMFNTNNFLEKLCLPLFNGTETSAFEFNRYYKNGYAFTLNSSDPKLVQQYYLNDIYPTLGELENYHAMTKYALVDNQFYKCALVDDPIKWQKKNDILSHFNMNGIFYILENNTEYFNVYGFICEKTNEKTLHYYLENLKIFEKFIEYFNYAAAELILDCEKQRLPLKPFYKLIENDASNTHLLNRFDTLIDDFSKKSSLILQNVKITKAQQRCLELLATGLTSKEVAKQLNISFRTVEQHVLNLREKFHLKNMKQLIYLFHQTK